jgi:hypothetical protein
MSSDELRDCGQVNACTALCGWVNVTECRARSLFTRVAVYQSSIGGANLEARSALT